MKFVVEFEIPDLPAEVMEIVEQTGGSVAVSFAEEGDDDGALYCLNVEICGGADGQAADMFQALESLPAYQNALFYTEPLQNTWFATRLDDCSEWVNAWEEEMKRRFPNVKFE